MRALGQLASVVLALLLLGAGCDRTGGSDDTRIDGTEAKRLVAEGARLVDVRTDAEYEAGHLPDAIHVPVSELPDRMGDLPRDHTLIVYCQSGVRSARAAAMLEQEGFDVRDLGGGIGAWPD